MALRIQQRIRIIAQKTEAIRKHPMCARFEDDGRRFVVYYPPGDFETAGVCADYTLIGKGVALERLLDRMESAWMGSYPAGSFR